MATQYKKQTEVNQENGLESGKPNWAVLIPIILIMLAIFGIAFLL